MRKLLLFAGLAVLSLACFVPATAQAQSLNDGASAIWCVTNPPTRPWLPPTTTLRLSIAYAGFQEHNKPVNGNVSKGADIRTFYSFSGFTFPGTEGRHELSFSNVIAPNATTTVTYRASWPRYVSDPTYPFPGRPVSPGHGQVSRVVGCGQV